MHIVDVPLPTRLDRYLRRLYPDLTQGILEKLLRQGQIKLNDTRARTNVRVVSGDEISIQQTLNLNNRSKDEQVFLPAAINLAEKLINEYVVYEDANLLAINKPASLATQGGSKIRISIQDAICYLNSQGADFKLVHRLDKETSGLLLIAKNYLAAYQLTTAFKERTIQKNYLAIVHSQPALETGEIQSVIAKNRQGAYEQIREDAENGKLAITRYKVLATNGNTSLVEFIPLTGRMHQLRFHAAKLGCPIIGDKKYGDITIGAKSNHMLLHAKKIIIPSSIWGEEIVIEIDLPEYFNSLW